MIAEFSSILRWPTRRWIVAAGATALALLLIGLPTVMIPSSFFARMTPTVWWEYPFWLAAGLLTGLTAATFVRLSATDAFAEGSGLATTASGGRLSAFAIGCPVCNKVVVALIGVSGALQIWAPLQPLLGVLSVVVLLVALRRRLAGDLACPAPRVDAHMA